MDSPQSSAAGSTSRSAAVRPPLGVDDWILLALLAVLALVATIPFWTTGLDVAVAGTFYDPATPDAPWPAGERSPWRWLYAADSTLTAGMALVPLGLILFARRSRRARRVAAFLFLSAALGPGLVVNTILKENWQRPRPRQLEVFGGDWAYVPPWAIGPAEDSASFPSGHVAIAAVYIAYALMFRRDRPRLAAACLVASLALTSAMGCARIVAGAHFLSDVLWAVILTTAVTWLMDRWLLAPRLE
jgi:lipid A 4'-phosphatase